MNVDAPPITDGGSFLKPVPGPIHQVMYIVILPGTNPELQKDTNYKQEDFNTNTQSRYVNSIQSWIRIVL